MKQTGIVRKLDGVERIVIPIEIRQALGWTDQTPVEISQFGQYIFLHGTGDGTIASCRLSQGNAVSKELTGALSGLSTEDTLLILELLHRLKRTGSSV